MPKVIFFFPFLSLTRKLDSLGIVLPALDFVSGLKMILF